MSLTTLLNPAVSSGGSSFDGGRQRGGPKNCLPATQVVHILELFVVVPATPSSLGAVNLVVGQVFNCLQMIVFAAKKQTLAGVNGRERFGANPTFLPWKCFILGNQPI